MRPEYIVLIVTVCLGVLGWGARALLAFTKEMTRWRVLLFDEAVGVITRLEKMEATGTDHERRIAQLENHPGRRKTDVHP